jgi:S1-C subfamily serine protease
MKGVSVFGVLAVIAVLLKISIAYKKVESQVESEKAHRRNVAAAIERDFRKLEEDSGKRLKRITPEKFTYVNLHYPTVKDIVPGSAAERAGIRIGDKILTFDNERMGRESEKHDEFFKNVVQARRNKEVSVVVKRAGGKTTLTLRVPPAGVVGLSYGMEKW